MHENQLEESIGKERKDGGMGGWDRGLNGSHRERVVFRMGDRIIWEDMRADIIWGWREGGVGVVRERALLL